MVAMVAAATAVGTVDLEYDARGGGRGEALVLTHLAILPLLCYLVWEAVHARAARDRGRATVTAVHFVLVLAASLSWHGCGSFDVCLVGTQSNAQRTDHFTAATSVSILLVHGMPTLIAYHRYLLVMLAYTIHALEFAVRPEHYTEARWSIVIIAGVYAGSHAQRCADNLAASITSTTHATSPTKRGIVSEDATPSQRRRQLSPPPPPPPPPPSPPPSPPPPPPLWETSVTIEQPKWKTRSRLPPQRQQVVMTMTPRQAENKIHLSLTQTGDWDIGDEAGTDTVDDYDDVVDDDETAAGRWSAVGAWKTLGFTDLSVPELFVVIVIAIFAGGFYGASVSRPAGAWKHSIWHVGAFLGALVFVRLKRGPPHTVRDIPKQFRTSRSHRLGRDRKNLAGT
jgi:hypothetical protein